MLYCIEKKNYKIKFFDQTGATESASVITSIEPNKTKGLIAKVFDSSGAVKSGIGIQIKVKVKEKSGGHEHHDRDRPNGNLTGPEGSGEKISGTTNTDGLQFSFTSPAISGDYLLEATCTTGTTCTTQGPKTLWAGIKDLDSLFSQSSDYVLIGSTSIHPDNHYMTLDARKKVMLLAQMYRNEFPGDPVLRLNDASLERGGLFDIKADQDAPWVPPHNEHRRGTVIDVRANKAPGTIPGKNKKRFKELVRFLGVKFRHESRGTTNEHFHIRLMGAAE